MKNIKLFLCVLFIGGGSLLAQNYTPIEIPSTMYFDDEVNYARYYSQVANPIEINPDTTGQATVQNSLNIGYYSEKRITVHPNSYIIPNDSNQIQLEIRKADLGLAWFEPNYTVGNILKYDKLELGIDLPDSIKTKMDNYLNEIDSTNYLNPYNPEDIDMYAEIRWLQEDSLWSLPKRVNCFYYREFVRDTLGAVNDWDWYDQNTEYNFRLRYTPDHLGPHRLIIKSHFADSTYLESSELLFEVIDSDHPGHVEVSGNHRYLHLDNWTFFPIGSNLLHEVITDPRTSEINSLKYGFGSADYLGRILPPLGYTYYLNMMEDYAASGANYFRNLAFPWTFELEFEKLNNYYDRMHMAWELDRVLDKAKELDLKMEFAMQLQYTLENPAYYNMFRWDWPEQTSCNIPENDILDEAYCYKDELNLTDPIEFFQDSEARKMWKRKLRYFIARYGYSPELAVLQFMSEPSETGKVTPYNLDNTSETYPFCVRATDDVDGPYEFSDVYQNEVYSWHHDMASYVKDDLKHFRQLLSTANAGENKVELVLNNDSLFFFGDAALLSTKFDINNWNQYTPDVRKYYNFAKNSSEQFEDQVDQHNQYMNCYCGKEHYNDGFSNFHYDFGELSTCKPFLFGEFGLGNFEDCDNGISRIQTALLSSFTGISGMAMSWDASSYANSDSWYLFGNIREFMEEADLVNKMWRPQADEVGHGYVNGGNNGGIDDYTASMVAISSIETFPEVMGAINNRTWNYYSSGVISIDSIFDEFNNFIDSSFVHCGEMIGLFNESDTVALEVEDTFLNVFTSIDNSYPLTVKHLINDWDYQITWFNPFTMDTVLNVIQHTDEYTFGGTTTQSSRITLNYPTLQSGEFAVPIYLFKLKPILTKNGQTEITVLPSNNGFNFNCYPNPSSEFLYIESKNEFDVPLIYHLLTIDGKRIKSETISNKLSRMNVNNLSPGCYLLLIIDKENNKELHKERVIITN